MIISYTLNYTDNKSVVLLLPYIKPHPHPILSLSLFLFPSFFSRFQSKVNQEDICEAMQKIDENNEGLINVKEFSQSVDILARGYGKYGKYGKSKDKVHV